jgi:hypothetical protein
VMNLLSVSDGSLRIIVCWISQIVLLFCKKKKLKLTSWPFDGLIRRVIIADDVIVEPQSVVECANNIPHQTLERGGGNWLIDGNRFPPDVVAGRISIDDDTASAVVRLVKVSRESIELKKNMRVGRGGEAVVTEAAPRCRLAADQTSVSGTQRADEGEA